MGWVTAIAAIVKAIPEIWKLINSLMAAIAEAKAKREKDDFEDRFKDRPRGPIEGETSAS